MLLRILEESEIRRIVEVILEDHADLFLIDFKLKGAKGNQKLLIFIDGDEGLTIDRCGQISRAIGVELEEGDFFEGKYTLEVSSPGLDFPLIHTRQYKKNVGRQLTIDLKEGNKLEGELLSVDSDGISISREPESMEIKWEEIEKTKIKISFK